MYIIVRQSDNTIIGCAVKPLSIQDMSRRGNRVYEVDDSIFEYSMIGQKLENFDLNND